MQDDTQHKQFIFEKKRFCSASGEEIIEQVPVQGQTPKGFVRFRALCILEVELGGPGGGRKFNKNYHVDLPRAMNIAEAYEQLPEEVGRVKGAAMQQFLAELGIDQSGIVKASEADMNRILKGPRGPNGRGF